MWSDDVALFAPPWPQRRTSASSTWDAARASSAQSCTRRSARLARSSAWIQARPYSPWPRGGARAGENLKLHEADATSLPVADASFDGAVCVQILEYVADIPAGLGELYRALRPGGREVVWDVDWATVSWHSKDPARMTPVLEAWDEHLAHPSLPRVLSPAMRSPASRASGWNLTPSPPRALTR